MTRHPSLDQPFEADRLREVMWLHHGHDGLYGDDGEMQCNRYPPADFRRDHIDNLIRHLSWTPLSDDDEPPGWDMSGREPVGL